MKPEVCPYCKENLEEFSDALGCHNKPKHAFSFNLDKNPIHYLLIL